MIAPAAGRPAPVPTGSAESDARPARGHAFRRRNPAPWGRILPPERGWAGLVAAALALLLAACGGGGGEQGSAAPASTISTTATSTPPTAAADPPAGAGSGAVPPGSAASSTTRPGRPSPTSTTSTTSTAPAGPMSGAPSGVGFTPPGIYRYAATGNFTATLGGTQARNGEVTLTVDPPVGTDQRSVRTGFGRTTEQVLRREGNDALLVSLRLTDQGIDKEVRPSPPGLALPGDAAPGRRWSWRAVSSDGRTTVDSAFTVVREEDVGVGADRVPALVVEVVLTITGDVVSTSKQTLWISAAHRLVVRQDDDTRGSFGLISFSGSSTEILRSLTPG